MNKNKSGFTLIEIIICISLLALIGVGCFIGIRIVNNKIKINNLEKMQEKIMNAVDVYIESNENVKMQLYENNNGVVIPLNTLQNEGIIDFDGIIDKKDDDYVVAVLATNEPNEECVSPYIKGSWQINTSASPIYVCTKSDGTSNLAIIDPSKVSNTNSSITNPYYFKGNPGDNYVEHNSEKYRIYKIDADDSLTLYSMNDVALSIDKATVSKYSVNESDFRNTLPDNVVIYNYNNCSNCYSWVYKITDNGHEYGESKEFNEYTYINYYHRNSSYKYAPTGYLYKISKCVKLSNGDGTDNNAYKLDNSMCN